MINLSYRPHAGGKFVAESSEHSYLVGHSDTAQGALFALSEALEKRLTHEQVKAREKVGR